ncbi:hypothetical protein SV7mr_35650 [Stieleria bergensis]|uniref:Cna protein B-type domain protein n=1 Tax=Stieleria bergensis TaxID=2528025 RepID=A0A517SY15_9BACT|nr:hypothetical protein SV7mr_35650 [Planctomycetes bacterium SV_7m_r]
MNTTQSKSASVRISQWSLIRCGCTVAASLVFVFSLCLPATAQEPEAPSGSRSNSKQRQDLKIRVTNIHGKTHPSENFSAYLVAPDGTHQELQKHPQEAGFFVAEQLPTGSYSAYIRGPETVVMHRFFFQASAPPADESMATDGAMATMTIPTAMLSTRRLHQLVERYMVQEPVINEHDDRRTFVNQKLSPTLPTHQDLHVETDRSLNGIVVGPTKTKGKSTTAHRANVLLLRGDVIVSRTTTDQDGVFFFETVRPGVSTLAVFHQSGAAIVPLHVKRNGVAEQAPNLLQDLPQSRGRGPLSFRMPAGQLQLVTRQASATVKPVAAVMLQTSGTPTIQINLANVGQSFQPLQQEVSGSISSVAPTSTAGGAAAAAGGLTAGVGGAGGAAAGGAAGVSSIGAGSVAGLSGLLGGEGEGIASPNASSPAVP